MTRNSGKRLLLLPLSAACMTAALVVPNAARAQGDPFGGGNGGFSGDPVQHTTVRFGPGKPEVAVQPSAESGAVSFDVRTPVGVIPILVQPAGPDLSMTPPPAAEPRPFRPPSIFSAPLPTGSGARALGFSGTFTAIADDATAASWNPAGLIQLKRPEVSFVYRNSWFRNHHVSSSPDLLVGTDDYHSDALNYLTVAAPFRIPLLGCNAVASLNYQEAYDFVSAFSARFANRGPQRLSQSSHATFTETQIDRFVFEPEAIRSDVGITTEVTTRSSSTIRQLIETELLADLDFQQKGVIDAISPAFAIEVNPRFALGLAVNFYQDNTFRSGGIRSTTRSKFTAISTSRSEIVNRRVTSVSYAATEATTIPGGGPLGPDDLVIESEPTSGTLPDVVQADTIKHTDVRIVEGEVIEHNTYEDLNGINATLGLWWVVSDFLTLGASVDMPWAAKTRQTRVLETATTTYDQDRSHILGSSRSSETSRQNVEFEFPLFSTLGVFLMWNPHLYTAVDVEYARWSTFAYNLQGEGRINPFDGTPHGQNAVDDSWAVRMGTEYLWELVERRIEIPLRFGLVWQQRPALGDPDDYYGFSLGTGVAMGPEQSKWILDAAYSYLQADNVQGVLPEEDALTTDTRQHQFFLSLIRHF